MESLGSFTWGAASKGVEEGVTKVAAPVSGVVDRVERVAVTMAEVVISVMTDPVTGTRTGMAATVDRVWVLAATSMPVVVVVVGVTVVSGPEVLPPTEGVAADEPPSRVTLPLATMWLQARSRA